jgi:branched-chain amino acid transport system permease protein
MAICYAVNRSRIGVRLTALRESEMAFSVLGHPPAAYRLFTICLSGAIATVAGAYFVFLQGLVPSYYFAPGLAVLYFGFAVAGGLGSIGGAVAAGGVFGALPRYFETLSEGRFVAYDQFFIGLVVFAVMLWLPGGLGGMARRAWHRVEGTAR